MTLDEAFEILKEHKFQINEAKHILNDNGYLLEDKAAGDYKTFKAYLKDFKEELLCQYMSPDIGERKYNKIISNEELLQNIKDNWANGDMCPSEMVEYILDNDLDESYKVDEDFTQGVRCSIGC